MNTSISIIFLVNTTAVMFLIAAYGYKLFLWIHMKNLRKTIINQRTSQGRKIMHKIRHLESQLDYMKDVVVAAPPCFIFYSYAISWILLEFGR